MRNFIHPLVYVGSAITGAGHPVALLEGGARLLPAPERRVPAHTEVILPLFRGGGDLRQHYTRLSPASLSFLIWQQLGLTVL